MPRRKKEKTPEPNPLHFSASQLKEFSSKFTFSIPTPQLQSFSNQIQFSFTPPTPPTQAALTSTTYSLPLTKELSNGGTVDSSSAQLDQKNVSQLPVDVYREVAQCLTDHKTIYNLLFVSRAFKDEAERHIYHTISSHEASKSLLSFFTRSLHLATRVRRISLSFPMIDKNWTEYPEIAVAALHVFVNLKYLTLSTDAAGLKRVLQPDHPYPFSGLLEGFSYNRPYDPAKAPDYILRLPEDKLSAGGMTAAHRLNSLSLVLPLNTPSEPVNTFFCQCIHLKELRLSGWIPRALLYPFVQDCTFLLRVFETKVFEPTEDICKLLKTQRGSLQELALDLNTEVWPAIAGEMRYLPHLTSFRAHLPLPGAGDRLNASLLLDPDSECAFQLRHLRTEDFLQNDDLNTFLCSQRHISRLTHETPLHDLEGPVARHIKLPQVRAIRTNLISMRDLANKGVKPLQLFWESESIWGNLGLDEDCAEVIRFVKFVRSLWWNVYPSELPRLTSGLPHLRYLGFSMVGWNGPLIKNLIWSLPSLEFLHLSVPALSRHIPDQSKTAGDLLECGYSIQRVYLVDLSNSIGRLYRRRKALSTNARNVGSMMAASGSGQTKGAADVGVDDVQFAEAPVVAGTHETVRWYLDPRWVEGLSC